MLYSKEDQILIHNLHVRKDMVLKIKSFYKRDWVCAVWIIF